uniref:Uncharacterized protein n=1 Tax=Globisporangium ultimum (strain ATCC 200006 / CBS 805.95 / DAOM BR144) TaxID=431595 RepID=K3WWE1_GLOUD
MSERTGKENMRTTRNSASHHSSGRTSKKAMTRRQSDSPLDERESLDQLHEDDELNARTKAKRRRVVNAPVEEERRKTQTQSRRQAVRADEEDDVDMAVGNNDEEEDENTVEEDADEPFEQTASEQEEEENDAMEEVNCERNDENDDPDAARDVDGGDDEVQELSIILVTESFITTFIACEQHCER